MTSRKAIAKAAASVNLPAPTRPTGKWTIRPSLLRLTILNLTFWAWAAIAAIAGTAGIFVYIMFELMWALILPMLTIAAVVLRVVAQRTVTITVVLSEEDGDTVTVERLFTSAILPERAVFQLEKLVSGDGLTVDMPSTLNNLLSTTWLKWLAVGTLTFSRAGTGGGITVGGLANPRGLEKWLRDAQKAIEQYEKAKGEAKKEEERKEEDKRQVVNMATAIERAAKELGYGSKTDDDPTT